MLSDSFFIALQLGSRWLCSSGVLEEQDMRLYEASENESLLCQVHILQPESGTADPLRTLEAGLQTQ